MSEGRQLRPVERKVFSPSVAVVSFLAHFRRNPAWKSRRLNLFWSWGALGMAFFER